MQYGDDIHNSFVLNWFPIYLYSLPVHMDLWLGATYTSSG